MKMKYLKFLIFATVMVWAPSRPWAQSMATGTVFRDCIECPELVVVPPGIFIMGLNGIGKRTKPAHRVNINRAFAIGRFEVTFDQWLACLAEKGCRQNPDDHKWGRGKRPVVNVNWNQVQNYLRWLSKKTGQVYRLPSEAEWEYANRAGTTSVFWWGNKPGKNRANCKDCGTEWSAKSTAPVGSFKPNPFGLYDTAANAFEWVEDCWNKSYKNAPNDGSAWKTGDCRNRVIRGGSFYYYNKVARSHYRAKNPPGVKSYWLGFRVVRELPVN